MPAVGQKTPNGTTTSYGQVIEYIQDRVYLASYTHPPNEQTPFPYPQSKQNSPHKRSKSHVPPPAAPKIAPAYFTVDDALVYNRFFADFGPLHIGHLYRFAVHLHEILADPSNAGRPVVFWSRADAKSRANAACLLACYMILIQHWPPHLALAPISQCDPPLMPFRDAGYSQADYGLTVQDVVYGVWKAKEEGLCGLKDFNLEEYERYERVDMGDFNWITPNFVAFASPQQKPVEAIPLASPEYAKLPRTVEEVERAKIPVPFMNVLCHFKEKNVGLVVRLNSQLYCPSYFTAMGIEHVDMIFDDGTCPALPVVRKFIKLAHRAIENKQAIAVHCKAGLGRTGCLIGAYLIYRHGFTANDLIAFMRFMRPGMVVGPQQHWLHLNQGKFREWWWEDCYKAKLALTMPATPQHASRHRGITASQSTPPSKRSALGEIDHNNKNVPATNAMDECLPAPTPGQPRKTSRIHSPARQARTNSSFGIATDVDTSKTATSTPPPSSKPPNNDAAAEEEWLLRQLSRRTSPSSAEGRRTKPRAISYTTTTTTTRIIADGEEDHSGFDDVLGMSGGDGVMSDVENWNPNSRSAQGMTADDGSKTIKPKTPRSGNGIGSMKVRASPRRSADSRGEKANGVRKTSGRVGSFGRVAAKAL